MDTSKLVVGQEVSMVSGSVYFQKGKVVKITSEGVEVEVRIGSWDAYERLYFDNDGHCYATENPMSPPERDGVNGSGTYEGGPWQLEDTEAAHYVVDGMNLQIKDGRATNSPLVGKTWDEINNWAKDENVTLEPIGAWHTCVDWPNDVCTACEAAKHRPDGLYLLSRSKGGFRNRGHA